MRILVITETWRPGVDGVVIRLEHTLAALRDQAHEVQVLAPTVGPPMAGVGQRRTAGVVIPVVDRRRRWGLPQPGLRRIAEGFGPDVVHVVNPVMFGSAAVRALVRRYPLVVSIHTDLSVYAAHYHLEFTRPLLRRINRATYRNADVRLATSAYGASLLGDLGLGSVGIWPPGVAADFVRAGQRRSGPPARGDDDRAGVDPVRLLGVGRLAPEKSWDSLVPLMRSVGPDESALSLTLVGDGPDRRRLERAFAGTATRFTGMLHGDELVEQYRRADVLVSPSTTETVGLTLLEAAACGLPVAAVDSPQVRATLGGRGRLALVGAGLRTDPEQWRAAIRSSMLPGPAVDLEPPLSWAGATDRLMDHYRTAIDQFGAARRGGDLMPLERHEAPESLPVGSGR